MTSLASKKVFVTGADGFIGSHVTEACVAAGARVVALSCYSSFDSDGWLDDLAPDVRAQIEVVRGDIRDGAFLRNAMRGADVVLHLAALIGIPYSYLSPSSYVDVNVQGSLNVFLAAQDVGATRIVQTSTSEVYGTALTRPIKEDHPLRGQSPYAASKIGADKMAEAMVRSAGLPIVILRPFNTYGPRQSQRAVIPTVVRQALDPNLRQIEVGDTTTERDWLFVEDTARAFVAAATAKLEYGDAYNAGSGTTVSVGTMIEQVRSIVGTDKPVVSKAERMRPEHSEVRVLQADSTRFETASGWRPSMTLADGLAKTIAWWQKREPEAFRRAHGYRV